jgi:hypothetical protein
VTESVTFDAASVLKEIKKIGGTKISFFKKIGLIITS